MTIINSRAKIRKYKDEILAVLIFMFFALCFNVYRVQGNDGFTHYALLEKILDVPDPECGIDEINNAQFEQSGSVFFNAPFYLAAYFIEHNLNLHFNFNGITLRQIAINLASNFYIALSLILIIGILKRLKLKYKLLPVISLLFSTGAFAAAAIQSSWNQSVDIFINTLIIFLFIKNYQEDNIKNNLWLGLLVSMAILIRYFNFLWAITFVLYFLLNKEYRRMLYFILGFIGSIWITPLLLYIYNGSISPLATTGLSIATINSFNYISVIPKHALKLLVHPLHGLFVWSPLTILSALGLALTNKNKIANLFISTWLLFVILYGFVCFWNAGWSFSNRYLVGLFPIYVIGLSLFLERFGKKTIWLVTILFIYSIILFLNWHLCIMNAEFGTPLDMIKAWIRGESATSIDKSVNLKIFLSRLWEMCRYKYIFRIFK